MPKTDRRELLRLALVAMAAPAVRADEPDPPRLTEAGLGVIHWGETRSGLQAGLRLLHPKAGYAVGERVELVTYVRNRTPRPIRFTYYQAFSEKTPTVTGPNGRAVWVENVIDTAAVQTGILVTLPAGETLVVNHPGLWFTGDQPGGGQFPSIPNPRPGLYRIAQSIPFRTNPSGRATLRPYPVTLFSAAGKPYPSEAAIVPVSHEETQGGLPTGIVQVTVRA